MNASPGVLDSAPTPPGALGNAPPGGAPSRLGVGHPLGRVARLALIAAVLAGAVFFEIPLCPFALVTRHPCPGCGLTRATLALLHGHVHDALRFHPLSLVVSPVVVGAFAYNAVVYVRSGRWAASERIRTRWITAASLVIGALMLIVWIARFLGAFGGPVPV